VLGQVGRLARRDGLHREQLGLGRILLERLPQLPMTVFVPEEPSNWSAEATGDTQVRRIIV
jgi:hypothetical protein